ADTRPLSAPSSMGSPALDLGRPTTGSSDVHRARLQQCDLHDTGTNAASAGGTTTYQAPTCPSFTDGFSAFLGIWRLWLSKRSAIQASTRLARSWTSSRASSTPRIRTTGWPQRSAGSAIRIVMETATSSVVHRDVRPAGQQE